MKPRDLEAVSVALCHLPLTPVVPTDRQTDARSHRQMRKSKKGIRQAPYYTRSPETCHVVTIRTLTPTQTSNLRFKCDIKCTNTLPSVCLCLSPSGSVSLSVFLVSVLSVICAVWLVALCGVCTWCQRKLVSCSAHRSHFSGDNNLKCFGEGYFN